MESEGSSPKHEVAFSFLAADLPLAVRFADSLAPLSTFVFSRQQEELAGTDGQESFRSAFRFDSRLNVVLLRDGWGQTPWTRVEQTAIQERCLADGWDRLLVVRLDGTAPPKWVPQLHLYLDMATFPFEQAVGAIKRQLQYLGGKPAAPSPVDAARATARRAQFDEQTAQLFRTPEGIRLADEAVVRIGESLERHLQAIAPDFGWQFAFGREGAGYMVLRVQDHSVLFNWQRYANTAENCKLQLRIVSIPIETPHEQKAGKAFFRYSNPAPLYDRTQTVYRTPDLGVCWQRGKELYSSERLADELLEKLVQALTKR
jgi:hypothetical protein